MRRFMPILAALAGTATLAVTAAPAAAAAAPGPAVEPAPAKVVTIGDWVDPSVHVRRNPWTHGEIVGSFGPHDHFNAACNAHGDWITMWNRGTNGWVRIQRADGTPGDYVWAGALDGMWGGKIPGLPNC